MSDKRFKSQSEIRQAPLQNAAKMTVIMEKDDVMALKKAAIDEDTTVNEILRVLVSEYLTGREG